MTKSNSIKKVTSFKKIKNILLNVKEKKTQI